MENENQDNFCSESHLEYDKIDINSIISAVDITARIGDLCAIVIDFDLNVVLYQTDHLLYLDEASDGDYHRLSPDPYWSLISEDTLNKLICIRNNFVHNRLELTDDEYLKLVCTIDFPILLHNHELFITQKITPIMLRNDGSIRVGLIVINESNQKSISSTIILENGRRFYFDFHKQKYIEYNLGLKLTHIEQAILHRAKMGYTINETADSLFISTNTVKTHRRIIFKKLNVKSITEALAMIDNYLIIT